MSNVFIVNIQGYLANLINIHDLTDSLKRRFTVDLDINEAGKVVSLHS